MSISTERPIPAAAGPSEGDERCFQCGSPLAADQEWCLECGAARTLIHRAPDWRIPLALMGTVVLLVLAGFAIALINLSSTANRQAAVTANRQAAVTANAASSVLATPAAAPPAKSPAATAQPRSPTTAAATPAFPDWPIGLPGWTVVLAAFRSQTVAEAKAKRYATYGLHVGVLQSSQHPDLTPGFWTVFTGRYPDKAAALASATQLLDRGFTGAHVRLVALPGSG